MYLNLVGMKLEMSLHILLKYINLACLTLESGFSKHNFKVYSAGKIYSKPEKLMKFGQSQR